MTAEIPGGRVHYIPGDPYMPTTFPHYDADTDTLIDHDYYGADEVAERLHVSQSYVYSHIRDGVWDALRVGRHVYMSAAQIGAAVEQMRTGPVALPEPDPPKLGEPVSDVDLEPLR